MLNEDTSEKILKKRTEYNLKYQYIIRYFRKLRNQVSTNIRSTNRGPTKLGYMIISIIIFKNNYFNFHKKI